MSTPACVQCGALLLPSDGGRCPYCAPPRAGDDYRDHEPADEEPREQPVELLPVETARFGPVDETLYQDARAILLNPVQTKVKPSLVLGLTLFLFVVSMTRGNSMRWLGILVGVLFFHEMGHWLGMRIFGYRDVKMFFIPFLGAAVSGKNEGAAQWKQAIVLLLGPLPGIFVGCFLLFWSLAIPHPLVKEIGFWLVTINAFNLLPFVPLDGGRLLNLVIFSRNRTLESVFLVITALCIIGLAVFLKAPFFAFVGVGAIFMVPFKYRIARSAQAIQTQWPELPARLADANDEELCGLFLAARKFTQSRRRISGRCVPTS